MNLASWVKWSYFLAIVASYDCGNAVIRTRGPEISYALERLNTNRTTNSLLMTMPALDSGFTFSISGEGFTSELEMGRDYPLQELTNLHYEDEGLYELHLQIKTSDGRVFLDDDLSWEYSLERPSLPIVNFSEKATSDDLVIMLLASNLTKKTTEIWVAGDVEAAKAPGYWSVIPSTLQVPVTTSPADGRKQFTIKYRNIYGNESDEVSLEIVKKSQGPLNCRAQLTATTTSSPVIRILLSVENEGDLFYTILGNLAKVQPFTRFVDSTIAVAELSGEYGLKNLTVKIRDQAGTYCPDLPLTITLDKDYIPYTSKVKGDLLWSDDRSITLVNTYDYLAGENAEMFISGAIEASEFTSQWVPFQEEVTLKLEPVEGNRFIYTRFRYREGTETDTTATHIYLKPSISISGLSSPRSVVVSKILDLVDLSISGCAETYDHVSFAASYPCTPNAPNVSVTYYLNDKTSLTRSKQVP